MQNALKPLSLVLLFAAAGVLTRIALKASEPDYVPPSVNTVRAEEVAPTKLSGEVPEGMLVRTFDIEGMCCTGCTAKLFDALEALPDVAEAAVSFESGTAKAVVSTSTDPALLVTALSFDKYSAALRP
jgi:copper chaperone CopZ